MAAGFHNNLFRMIRVGSDFLAVAAEPAFADDVDVDALLGHKRFQFVDADVRCSIWIADHFISPIIVSRKLCVANVFRAEHLLPERGRQFLDNCCRN